MNSKKSKNSKKIVASTIKDADERLFSKFGNDEYGKNNLRSRARTYLDAIIESDSYTQERPKPINGKRGRSQRHKNLNEVTMAFRENVPNL